MSIFAHGPTPQKVQESITVSVTPAKAWSTVKDFSSFKKIMKIRSFDDEIMKIKYEMKYEGMQMNSEGNSDLEATRTRKCRTMCIDRTRWIDAIAP